MFSMVLVGSGSSHFLKGIRIQGNDTDSTDPDPPHCFALLHLRFFILAISALRERGPIFVSNSRYLYRTHLIFGYVLALKVEKLDVKDECGAARDLGRAAHRPVPILRPNTQFMIITILYLLKITRYRYRYK